MLYPPLQWEIDALVKNEIEITICDEDSLDDIAANAQKHHVKAKIHFQVETGMHRYGMLPETVVSLVKKASHMDSIQVEGISTHFATALTDPNFATQHQFPVFLDVLTSLANEGISIPTIHIANSPGLMRVPQSWNPETYAHIMPNSRICVRPGEIVYGIRRDIDYAFETKPVLHAIISHLVDIQAVKKGEAVGYDNGFTAHSDMTIGVIACGWRESSLLFKNGDILVHDILSPQIGSIFGNAIAIDNKGQGMKNDRVYLVKQDNGSPKEVSIREIALRNNMPPTAVITLMGTALPRVYFTDHS